MNKTLKKTLSIILTILMIATTVPFAFAADTSGDSVTIDLSTVTQDILLGENHTYSLDGGAIYTAYAGNLIFTGTTAYSIIINEGAGIHDIVLDNVRMSNKNENGNIKVSSGESLNLTLKGTNTLAQIGGLLNNNAPAINLNVGATLTITEASTGILNAQGGYACPAIGGRHYFTVNINGGTVDVGPYHSSGGGIGFEYQSVNTRPTTINISNAIVNATGEVDCAAIGGGLECLSDGSSVNITITHSTVTASSTGINKAAIGAGKNDKNTYNIKIVNSVVSATSGMYGAAIGNSRTGTVGNIEIIDSIVTATAGSQAAGIGGGPENNVGNILIQNSTVTATGGNIAAGIGGGYENTVSGNDKVTIIGSNVYASGYYGRLTVGRGYSGAVFPICNADGSNVALTKITLQGVSRDVKVTKISTATGYEEVDIMTIGGVLYIWLPDGESPTEVIANGQKYVGTVTDKVGTFVFEHTCEVGENGTPASCGQYAVCGLCNQDFGEMVSHNFKYSATDNAVTETCSNNCGHNENATLTASDANYIGSAITNATVTYSDGWMGSKEHSEIAYSNNTNIGTATANVTVGDYELTTTFKINAANLSEVKVEQISILTYNGGEALAPTVSASAVAVNNQPVTFTFSMAQDGPYESMPSFTEAGTYTVYFKASAPNHNEATGSFAVMVDKAVPSYAAPTPNTLTYDGGNQELVTAGSTNDGEMEYSLNGESWSTDIPVATATGEYIVYYRVKGNKNYYDYEGSVTVTIGECLHESITDGKCDACGYVCTHENYTDENCDICGIQKADYSGYFDALDRYEALTGEYGDVLVDDTKDYIQNVIQEIVDEYLGDEAVKANYSVNEQYILNGIADGVNEICDTIENGIADGTLLKADYTEIDEAIKAIEEALEASTISDEMKAELENIKVQLEELKEDANISKADLANSGLLDRAEAIAEVMNNCANGVHEFGEYTSNGDATCEADGTKTAECIHGCGETDTVADEGSQLDHADEDGDKICDDCQAEIIDTCPDCGRPVHEGQINEYICLLITLIKLVVSLVKTLVAVA